MPKFFYIARDKQGQKKIGGVEEGSTQEEVLARLQAKGLLVVSIMPEEGKHEASGKATPGFFKKKSQLSHNKVSEEDLVLYCRQLATLLSAGVTLLKSLNIISLQIASKKLYNALLDMRKNMEGGLSLHEAMAKHPKIFSDLWVSLVESGEASGNLPVVLNRLAGYLERSAGFKSKIISALIYPGILLSAGLFALFFMTIKIIPTFAEIFRGMDIELPALTQGLVNFSYILRKYFLLLALALGGGIFAFKKYTSTLQGRRKIEELQFKLPVIGNFFRAVTVEKFSSGMSTLLESGVPILYALEITEHSVDNLIMSDIVRKVKDDIREGKSLSGPLEKSGFFEPMVVQMVAIGEEVGELSQMFKRINDFYQEYADTFLTRIVAMFEPVILIFMGGIIGIMVIGMFMPIFKIASLGG